MNLKIQDILKCTQGKLIIGDENKICENYSKDTRTLKKGDTFIGIKGDKYDGNLCFKEALDKGADTVIINNTAKLNMQDIELFKKQHKNIIQVENTITALGQIATYKRELYGNKLKVIGITGSTGKTSTKDMIANVISQKYKTLKTEGNNNNHIGLPFTILRLKDEQVAVIEMGMNHLGEISYLTQIAKPDISVITNIGTSHIGNLGSRENILKAKLEILDGMKNKLLVLNNDNDLLNKWIKEYKEKIEIHTFGIKENSEFKAEEIKLNDKDSNFICINKNNKINVSVPVGGIHFILNALCAIAIGNLLNINNEQIINGIKNFKLTSKRMEIHNLKNNITIINDSYNASYESMRASILSLKNMRAKRKIAVLGDMLELGKFSEKLHRDVGSEIYTNNIDKLFVIGEDAIYIAKEAKKLGFEKENIFIFNDKKTLINKLKESIQSGDAILFKASNSMHLYEIAEEIKVYIENQ